MMMMISKFLSETMTIYCLFQLMCMQCICSLKSAFHFCPETKETDIEHVLIH